MVYNDDRIANIKNKNIINYNGSLPRIRWGKPFHDGVAATSQAFTAGTVLLSEFELEYDSYIDAIVFVAGATSQGNVRAGIYGPISTEETCLAATLLVESASTASAGNVNTPQIISVTKTLAVAGRYYVALQSDDSSNTYMRQPNQTQVAGWGQTYARAGGYGAFTTPCPTVTNTGSAIPALKVRLAIQ